MYRTASFLKLVTLAILCTIFVAVTARTELSAAQITLSWTDNSNNEDGFRVERKIGTAGTFAPLITLAANAGSHVDSNLADATTFCYRLNAFNAAGSSAFSNEMCKTTPSVTPPIYLLSVSKAGTGSGTVTAPGINCGSDCSESVVSGTQVALVATAAGDSTFIGWTGTGCGSTVTVTGNLTCTATFNLSTFTLTVAKAGTGSGTVTATGINCGSDCSESVASGTQVTLTATAAGDSTFAGWTGTGCSSTATVTGNLTCTATFNLRTFTLTVAKRGTGSGTVTATGINCGSDCSESVVKGTQVTLTATAASDSTFIGWTGTGCSSTVTVTGNKTCTATFNSLAFMDRIGIYRPSTGEWFLDSSGSGVWDDCQIDLCIQSFGAGSGVPVVGEWDASGLTQIGIFGPQTAQWNMDKNTNETWDGCTVDLCLGPFGVSGDLPVVGKWTSGGYDRVGVFRPSTGNWYLDKNNDGSFTSCQSDQCAYLSVYMTGDLPVVGDWKGAGVSRLGLFRPSTGEWFLDYNGNRSWNGCSNDRCKSFGAAGDQPVTGDWNGSGSSKIGVFRPSTGAWFLDYNGNGIWDGCSVDVCLASFGLAGDVPFAGKW